MVLGAAYVYFDGKDRIWKPATELFAMKTYMHEPEPEIK